ncbi:hypothetical protein [Streptomyces chiangmaiensis]|uniref:Uncharacterized protein n=1 Tax=Streptomyces chiangmaiensis TaxID=766497 RepID=A0ABU7FNG9_9ACTN|nr:hypothetical protein [Streptomyces chiangmaiensis]MED7825583.1 hypothetical protein [Streptomyces chiangmaiensis]
MRPDQTLVTLQREGTRITARASEPFIQEAAAGTSEHDHPYGHLTMPLRQRGLSCTVEYGLSDYIVHAELPDGSALIIAPPQEPPTDHPPGYPGSWLVTRGHPDDSTLHEVIYDSEPDGPHARHGGSIPRLLAAIDTRLDQLGLPPRPEPRRPAQESSADAVLHRAGFVPVVLFRERFHRLPSAMTDPVEQRQMVTRAFDMLQAEGFNVSCDPSLLDPSLPPPGNQGLSLGDRLGHLTQSIRSAAHTREVVAALSELTAPGDGVHQRVVESLNTTADWSAPQPDLRDVDTASRRHPHAAGRPRGAGGRRGHDRRVPCGTQRPQVPRRGACPADQGTAQRRPRRRRGRGYPTVRRPEPGSGLAASRPRLIPARRHPSDRVLRRRGIRTTHQRPTAPVATHPMTSA